MKEFIMLAPKGGVGKSTLVECFRQYLGNAEVVDLDPQRTLSIALEMLGTPLSPPKKDYRLYDTPPYNDESLRPIMAKVDHIIIPSKLGYPDLIALRTIYDSLIATKTIDKAILVFNEVRKPLTTEEKKIIECYSANYKNLRQAKTLLSRLDGFLRVFRTPLKGKSLEQIKALVNEILNLQCK